MTNKTTRTKSVNLTRRYLYLCMLLQNTCYFFGKIIIDWGYLITGFYSITITNVSATGNKWLHLEIVLSQTSQTLQVTRRFLDSKKFQTQLHHGYSVIVTGISCESLVAFSWFL